MLLAAFIVASPQPNTAAAAPPRTVPSELERLRGAGAISAAQAEAHGAEYRAARGLLARLSGARRAGLAAPLGHLERIARDGQLTAGRLPALMLTVTRNRQAWCCEPMPRAGQRRRFGASQLVWQHYPGQGWQIQWLGTFGRANALWSHTGKDDELRALLTEAVALAAPRAGGIAWEYLFAFGGGRPPWVSAMAQATGMQALARAAVRLGEPAYFQHARAALPIFGTAPPTGVRVRTAPDRAHYLLYSYASRLRVLNAFTQAVNGLHDFAVLANDDAGRSIYLQGARQLTAELAGYDTGGWSRYALGGPGSNVGYHTLARDVLRGLCDRTRRALTRRAGTPGEGAQAGGATPAPPAPAPAAPGDSIDPEPFCALAERFTADLVREPRLRILTARAVGGRPGAIRVALDKPAMVTVTVSSGGRVIGARTASVQPGATTLRYAPRARPGRYVVTARARDLLGRDAEAVRVLTVSAPEPDRP